MWLKKKTEEEHEGNEKTKKNMGYVKFSQAGEKIIWSRSTSNNAIDLKIINEKTQLYQPQWQSKRTKTKKCRD